MLKEKKRGMNRRQNYGREVGYLHWGLRDEGGLGAHPAGPVDEVVQLGHHIFTPTAGKCTGFGDHGSGLGHSRLDAGHATRHGEVLARQEL